MKLETKLKSEDLFDSLEDESEQPVERKIEVERTPTLEKLTKKFDRQLKRNWGGNFKNQSSATRHYNHALKNLSTGFKHNLSAQDVEQFSILLIQYDDLMSDWRNKISEHAGIYLSAMVTASDDNDFVIHTKQLQTPVDLIGFENTKNVTVNGNAGDHIGCKMKDGKLLVRGNVKSIGNTNAYGPLENGYVEVTGDVGTDDPHIFGSIAIHSGNVLVHGDVHNGIWYHGNPDSLIRIKGDVHGTVASHRSGEVYLEGDYEKIELPRGHDYRSVKIFHKGEPIVNGLDANVPKEKIKWSSW
jgi:formylmethanofuran dehydrogenase subunit C